MVLRPPTVMMIGPDQLSVVFRSFSGEVVVFLVPTGTAANAICENQQVATRK